MRLLLVLIADGWRAMRRGRWRPMLLRRLRIMVRLLLVFVVFVASSRGTLGRGRWPMLLRRLRVVGFFLVIIIAVTGSWRSMWRRRGWMALWRLRLRMRFLLVLITDGRRAMRWWWWRRWRPVIGTLGRLRVVVSRRSLRGVLRNGDSSREGAGKEQDVGEPLHDGKSGRQKNGLAVFGGSSKELLSRCGVERTVAELL